MHIIEISRVLIPVQTNPIPLASSFVSAGFPSPADDHIEDKIDLNALLIPSPASTFFVRVQGRSMEGAGICPNDILVVDRALTPRHKDIVLAVLHGDFTVKRWTRTRRGWQLQSEHPNYPAIPLHDGMDFSIWGVVTHAIHSLRSCSP